MSRNRILFVQQITRTISPSLKCCHQFRYAVTGSPALISGDTARCADGRLVQRGDNDMRHCIVLFTVDHLLAMSLLLLSLFLQTWIYCCRSTQNKDITRSPTIGACLSLYSNLLSMIDDYKTPPGGLKSYNASPLRFSVPLSSQISPLPESAIVLDCSLTLPSGYRPEETHSSSYCFIPARPHRTTPPFPLDFKDTTIP